MYKKLSILLMLIMFLFTAYGCERKPDDLYEVIKKRGKIIVGVKYDAKPFGFLDERGKPDGVDIDIAYELADRLLGDRYKVEFRRVTPSSRIQAVTSGDVDMIIATMSITEARKELLDFSDSYYIAGQAIVARNNGHVNTTSDLNRKKVLVILGTTGEKTIRMYAHKAILVGAKSYESAFSSLKSGAADALTTDDSLLYGFVMDNPEFKMLPRRLTEEHYAIAFKKSEETKTLQKHVNYVLTSMRNDGTLNKIKRKWNVN